MADSSSPVIGVVVLADAIVTLTLTDLGPVNDTAPRLTPTGRPRRTRAEITIAAAERRQRLAALKAERDTKRLQARQKRAKEKAERARRTKARREAAEVQRIERQRKAQARAQKRRGRQVMAPKPETPRHLRHERFEDDPGWSNWSHVADERSLNHEDTLIAWMDGEGTEMEDELEALLVDLRIKESIESQARQTEHLASLATMFPDDRGDSIKWNREARRLRNLRVFHNPGGRRRFAA